MGNAPDAPSPAPGPDDLAAAFGLVGVGPASLSPWSSVFRATAPGGAPVVVKRTAHRAENARAMAAWTAAASATGFGVVAPVPLPVDNPQLVGDDWWVVYPWVEGEVYRGDREQVRQAGDLLGRQHALAVDASALRGYRWPDVDPDGVAAELATLAERVPEPDLLADLAGRWARQLPALRSAGLPAVGVSSDFKAVNLVWTGARGPVLVDPDNGGREPRLFDLALAVLLFHHECPTAPGRLFDAGAWVTFRDAYRVHVRLGATEQRLWVETVDHLLWEEGSWALAEADADAWADPRQGAFLRDLATTRPDRFPLT